MSRMFSGVGREEPNAELIDYIEDTGEGASQFERED